MNGRPARPEALSGDMREGSPFGPATAPSAICDQTSFIIHSLRAFLERDEATITPR